MARLYEVDILGTTYRYRGATRKELEEALQYELQVDMEDFLCGLCVVYPDDLDLGNCLAGIPTQLAEKILEASGMTPESTERLQKEAEEWIVSPSGKMEVLMMGVLHLPLEQIKSMDPPDWFKAAGASQLLAASIYGLDLEKFMTINPFEEPKKKGSKRPTLPAPNNPNGQVIPPVLLGPGEIPEHELRQWEEDNKSIISK